MSTQPNPTEEQCEKFWLKTIAKHLTKRPVFDKPDFAKRLRHSYAQPPVSSDHLIEVQRILKKSTAFQAKYEFLPSGAVQKKSNSASAPEAGTNLDPESVPDEQPQQVVTEDLSNTSCSEGTDISATETLRYVLHSFCSDATWSQTPTLDRGVVLAGDLYASKHPNDFALLGHQLSHICSGSNSASGDSIAGGETPAVYLNTDEPFCMVAVGVQGGGKSNSIGCVLENCLLPFVTPPSQSVNDPAPKPMNALVLHTDNSPAICELAGLAAPSDSFKKWTEQNAERGVRADQLPNVACGKVVVLVSPTYFLQRKTVYGKDFDVRPLLFSWKDLSADHIKRLMLVQEHDAQLYIGLLLSTLRQYQARDTIPSFTEFVDEMLKLVKTSVAQASPLRQRLQLLMSLVQESDDSQKLHSGRNAADLKSICEGGQLVIVDLTDPMLSRGETNSIFQVLVEQYSALPCDRFSKLLVVDEAHKFMDGVTSDGLSAAIVNVARLMRHTGTRLAVSTQSPLALAPELLELVSVALLHKFHSADWFAHLSKKIPLEPCDFETIKHLKTGNAVVFASRHQLLGEENRVKGDEEGDKGNIWKMRIRRRFTADLGASRCNNSTPQMC